MTNWASEVITETASASGRDPVEANRVTLTVAGGPVVVQWSLSYDRPRQHGLSRSRAEARLLFASRRIASLERDGVEIARWTLADQAQDLSLPSAQAWVTGTASGLFVDHASDLRAQDLRPEGLEQGPPDQRQHAHHDLRGALIARHPLAPVRRWSAHARAGYLIARVPAGAANSSSGAHAPSNSGGGSGQALRRGGRGRPPQLRGAGGLDHGAARRERRRQDHHDRHHTGAARGERGAGHGAGRGSAAPPRPGARTHELLLAVRRSAVAAERAAESPGLRRPVSGRPRGCAHRRARGAISISWSCSIVRPGGCLPGRRPA